MRAPLPSPRSTGLLGLGSIAAILGGALVTAIPYRGWAGESYSPLNHFVSELGEIARSQASPAFNLGIIAGGLGLGLFLILLSRRLTGRYRPAMAVAGLVADVSGTLVGIFPMDYHPIHGLVSAVFFCSGWIVMALFSGWLLTRTRTGLGFGRWLFAPAAVGIAASLAFVEVYANYSPLPADVHIMGRPSVWTVPLLEWVALVSLLAWFACVALEMVRAGRERD
jgi:hypothetical membrane protein